MPGFSNQRLYPVIMAVPEKDRLLKGRDKVKTLSRHARYALDLSTKKSGVVLNNLSKNEKGAPLPENGVHWSLTHKIDFVGAVAAPLPIGVDIEKIKPCSDALLKKVADKKEWALGAGDPAPLFFRFWTAKEAVLKAVGKGISGIAQSRIDRILDDSKLIVSYGGKMWAVEHYHFNGHIASITSYSFDVSWTLF